MNKTTFMNQLRQGLKKVHINDVDEILEDYEEYFYQQSKLGKAEEDIAARLGDVNKIVDDYKKSDEHKKTQWFDLVSIGFVAIPLLIMLYGLLIVFIGTTVSFWAIAIYYLFQVETFKFMPYIPRGIDLIYVVTCLSWAVFFFSLSVRFFIQLKSMTMQFVVRQTIRIGDYVVKPVYAKLFKYSLWVGTLLIVISYVISALFAKDFEYWHVWQWFV